MRSTVLSAALLALTGAPALAQSVTAAQAESAAECECPGCQAKRAKAKANRASQEAADELVRLGVAIDELEGRGADVEPKDASEQVRRALETKLSDVEALLAPSAEVQVSDVRSSEPVAGQRLQGLGYLGDVEKAPAPRRAAGQKGYLGVMLSIDEEGVAIQDVADGSPAQESGIKPGDVLFNVGGDSVIDMESLQEAIGQFSAGEIVQLGLVRDDMPMRLRVKLGDASVLGTVGVPQVAEVRPALPSLPQEEEIELRWNVELDDVTEEAKPERVRIRLALPEPEGVDSNALRIVEEFVVEEEERERRDGRKEANKRKKREKREARNERKKRSKRERKERRDERDDEREWDEHEELEEEIHMLVDEIIHRLREEGALDPLPEGYEEVVTRRERRPAHGGHLEELHERIEQLEEEIERLMEELDAVHRELDRRNPG